MGDFGAWLQDNWYELGTLLTLMAFLVAAVWFASNFLKAIRTFPDRIGALLKFSVANPGKRPLKSPSPQDALVEGISSWLETPGIDVPKPEVGGSDRAGFAGSRVFSWLQAPIRAASVTPWRRMARWLQAPIGS